MDNPEAYAVGHSLQRISNLKVLELFRPNLLTCSEGDPESILDIGCGDGEFTANVLLQKTPKGSKILGVDISEKMIQYATEKYGSENENVNFKHIDLLGNENDLQQYLGCFDNVFSFFCLHWVKDLRQPMENIYKIIRPGGTALLSFVISSPFFQMYGDAGKLDKWNIYFQDIPLEFIPPYANCRNPVQVFSNLAKDVGFSVLLCETHEMNYTFKTEKELKETVKGAHPLLKFIPEQQHEDFLQNSVKILQKLHADFYPGSNGTLDSPYKIIVAHLKKNVQK